MVASQNGVHGITHRVLDVHRKEADIVALVDRDLENGAATQQLVTLKRLFSIAAHPRTRAESL